MGHVNLYEALGVDRQDCAVAVRHAYRDLARLAHTSTESIPAFVQEIDLAVAVLSDGARRAHYDQLASDAAGEDEAEPSIDLLRDFEGGPPSAEEVRHAFRCNFAPGAEPKSARVEALDLWIRIASAEVVSLGLPVFRPCARCHGTGSVNWCACGACEGSGLAEERSTIRVVAARERVVSLDWLGVRSPILRLRVTAFS